MAITKSITLKSINEYLKSYLNSFIDEPPTPQVIDKIQKQVNKLLSAIPQIHSSNIEFDPDHPDEIKIDIKYKPVIPEEFVQKFVLKDGPEPTFIPTKKISEYHSNYNVIEMYNQASAASKNNPIKKGQQEFSFVEDEIRALLGENNE